METQPSQEERARGRLRIALIVSLIVHLLLLPASRFQNWWTDIETADPEPISVELIEETTPEPPQPPSRQIVDLPESEPETPIVRGVLDDS